MLHQIHNCLYFSKKLDGQQKRHSILYHCDLYQTIDTSYTDWYFCNSAH
jgi:hypothetical protein